MPSEKETVHIIDDDDALRESLAFLLRTASIEAATYPSVAAFLEEIPGAKLSCVITDVRMPGMSGIDLLKRLREMKIDVPVIVITGHGDVPLAAKMIAVSGFNVDRNGKIIGHGHATRDTVEWMLPPLWPWKVLSLPARGPRPGRLAAPFSIVGHRS